MQEPSSSPRAGASWWQVRPADPADVPELIRLRHAMFREMAATGVATRPAAVENSAWYPAAATVLANHLSTGAAAAFVIQEPNGDLVIASAVASVEQRLPGPGFPTGRSGSMSSVFVEPKYRRQGAARAVVTAALTWLDHAGAEITDIHATPGAAHLYRSLGFTAPRSTPLRRPAP